MPCPASEIMAAINRAQTDARAAQAAADQVVAQVQDLGRKLDAALGDIGERLDAIGVINGDIDDLARRLTTRCPKCCAPMFPLDPDRQHECDPATLAKVRREARSSMVWGIVGVLAGCWTLMRSHMTGQAAWEIAAAVATPLSLWIVLAELRRFRRASR